MDNSSSVNMFLNTLNTFSRWQFMGMHHCNHAGPRAEHWHLGTAPGKEGAHITLWIGSLTPAAAAKGRSNSQIWLWWPKAEACSSMLSQQATLCACQATCASFGHCSGVPSELAANTQQCCSSFKIALGLWGSRGRKKCGIEKSGSLLRKPVLRKTAAYFLRLQHMPILPSHPQGRLKGM